MSPFAVSQEGVGLRIERVRAHVRALGGRNEQEGKRVRERREREKDTCWVHGGKGSEMRSAMERDIIRMIFAAP